MICPWLKDVTYYKSSVRDDTFEEYNGCYKDECPWYRPEYSDGTLIVEAKCLRVDAERDKAKGGGDNGKD